MRIAKSLKGTGGIGRPGFARMALCLCVVALLMCVHAESIRKASAGDEDDADGVGANKLTISELATNADDVLEQLDLLKKEKRWLDYFKTSGQTMETMERHGEKLYQVTYDYYENFGITLRRRIRSLPGEAYDVFREYYDTAAGVEFSAWERTHDPKVLVRIVERYFPSSFADEALLKLGSLDFEAGRYRRAAKWYRMLIDFYPDPDQPKEDVLVRTAFAYCAAGDAKKILELLKYAKANGMDKKTTSVLAEKEPQTIGKLLLKLTDGALHRRIDRARLKKHLADWPTLRGNQQRNRLAEKDLVPGRKVGPPYSIRDYGSPVESVSQRNSFSGFQPVDENEKKQDGSYYYPFFPIVNDGKVYIPAQHYVGVMDLKTGKRLRPLTATQRPYDEENRVRENNRQLIYSLHADRDGIYTSLTTDKWGGDKYHNTIDIRCLIYLRDLFAFKTSGKGMNWSTRPITGFSDNERDSVPTVPVRVGDKMIIPVYDNSEWIIAKLRAFNVHSGKTEWETPICYNKQELTMFGAQSREPLVSPLAERDGIVYFSTNLGALAAVDGETGRTLWIRAYDEIRIKAAKKYTTKMRNIVWENSPPVIADGVVIFTPLDSKLCYAFDLETGKLRWNVPFDKHSDSKSKRQIVNRLIGVAGGKVIFTGTRVMAINMKTGMSDWIVELERNRYAVAAGCLSKRYAYIPHKQGFRVYDIRNDGDLVHEHTFSRPAKEAGNILIAGDYFITTSKTHAAVFRGVPLEKRSSAARRSATKESD